MGHHHDLHSGHITQVALEEQVRFLRGNPLI